MGHLSSEAIGSILDHFSDVIEGGNAYNGSTSYRGIAGTRSSDDGLRNGSDGSFVCTGTPTTTTTPYGSGNWSSDRWVKAQSPGFFLVDAAQEAARRITGWNNTTKVFTTDAFPAAPTSGNTILVRQGFRRIPNNVDINDDAAGVSEGYDRHYSIDLTPGVAAMIYGVGTETRRAELSVTLRILKYGRELDARRSVLENIAIIATALQFGGAGSLPNHRDGTYVRAVLPPTEEPDIVSTAVKTLATVRLPLVYRVNRLFS